MRVLGWVGVKVGEGIYWLLHTLLGIDPPKYNR